MVRSLAEISGKSSASESNNKVGTIESMLSGIVSGIIA